MYVDGKASMIQAPVLDGVDQFERAVANNPELEVVVDGRRNPKWLPPTIALGLVGVPLVGLAAAHFMGSAPPVKTLWAMGAAMAALPAAMTLRESFQGRNWEKETRYNLSDSTLRPTPEPEQGVARLRSLMEQNASHFPGARHLVYFSGHGDQEQVAGMKFTDLGEQLSGQRVDGVVLDACLTNQLEVMAQLAPWAGVVLTSTHVVPAKGLPIEDMFSVDILQEADVENRHDPDGRGGGAGYYESFRYRYRGPQKRCFSSTRPAGEFVSAGDQRWQWEVGASGC